MSINAPPYSFPAMPNTGTGSLPNWTIPTTNTTSTGSSFTFNTNPPEPYWVDTDGDLCTTPKNFAKVRPTDVIVARNTHKIFIWDVIFKMRTVKNYGRYLDASNLDMVNYIRSVEDAANLYASNSGYAGMDFTEFILRTCGKPKRLSKAAPINIG